MIRGIGIDLAEIDRIRAITERFGSRFVNRIFTENEIAYCQQPNKNFRFQSLAARFAAKEAFYKAVFPILRHPIPWHSCEVLNDADGVPKMFISEELNEELQHAEVLLSISHSGTLAVAIVIVL